MQNELSINGIETQIDDIHTGKQSDDDIDELSINEIETQKNDYHTGKQSDDDIDELSINEIETQKNDNHTGKQSDVDIEDERKEARGKLINKVRKLPPRSRNLPKHLNDYACSNIDFCYKVMNVPKTYKEALETSYTNEWKKAMNKEMDSLIENNTFNVVSLPANKNPVGGGGGGRWVYSIKSDPGGNTMHKARFVAKGYSQVLGSDYFDTFSPTAKITTIRMMMQISAENNLLVHQLDVKDCIFECPNRLRNLYAAT